MGAVAAVGGPSRPEDTGVATAEGGPNRWEEAAGMEVDVPQYEGPLPTLPWQGIQHLEEEHWWLHMQLQVQGNELGELHCTKLVIVAGAVAAVAEWLHEVADQLGRLEWL